MQENLHDLAVWGHDAFRYVQTADRSVVLMAGKAIISIVLIYIVLLWLAAVYRGGVGNDEIQQPVSLTIVEGTSCLVLGPRHLNERRAHHAKAPKVLFYLQLPNAKRYRYKIAAVPLKLTVRDRNRGSIFDQAYDNADLQRRAPGGQVGIDHATHEILAERLAEFSQRERRQVDPDTSEFVIRLRYPSSLNLWYLLVDHPDTSVRVGAWVFILTSLFTVLQEFLTNVLQVSLGYSG